MTEKTLTELENLRSKTNFIFALAGNCNVGKSTIFNNLTGIGVLTANFPGKTVELNLGLTRIDGIPIGIVDLPGIYSLGCFSEDQYVARQTLLEYTFDAIIFVLDATNLARNLFALLQILDLGFPVIAALNLVDEAHAKGITIDTEKMEKALGIKVVPTSAVRGDGIKKLIHEAMEMKSAGEKNHSVYRYGSDIENEIKKVTDTLHSLGMKLPYPVSYRACALLLLEKDKQFLQMIESIPQNEAVLRVLEESWRSISQSHGEDAALRIIRERHGHAGSIALDVLVRKVKRERFLDKLWRLSTDPVTGFPILIAVFVLLMAILFTCGNRLSDILIGLWSHYCSVPITAFIKLVAGETIWAKILTWGFDNGILAIVSVGIPYVLVFYLLLSFLEDTGYLNSAAFLLDRALHGIGLHGRAFMPLAAAIGCNVPAVIGTRVLGTLRERIIAIFLIVLVSCSTRTAVVVASVSRFLGWFWVFAIIMIDIALVISAGMLMNRFVRGESEGLVMEVFPLRLPDLKIVLKKTWVRFADFIYVAPPIVIAGSMALGYLYETQLIWKLSKPLSPIIEGWLGLPAFAGLTLLFGVLRKELALQFIFTLAIAQQGHSIDNLLSIMTKEQIFTFTLVNTLYLPCLATIAVIFREIGLKWTFLIMSATLFVTIFLAGIIHHLLLFTGILA